MEAVLDKVRRKPIQGDEQEIARDLPCEIDTEARQIRIAAASDLGIRVGDEIESDALDRKMAVSGVRRERTEDGYTITIRYR